MPNSADNNLNPQVARGFGQEWSTFRQDADHLSPQQRQDIFEDYFRIFPWRLLPTGASINGSAIAFPSTVVRKSVVPIADALRGRKRTLSKIEQFSRIVTSPSAPPSI